MAEPLPVKEAVSAPARMNWSFTSPSSGHFAKTTSSKSFSAGPQSFKGNCDHTPKAFSLKPESELVNFRPASLYASAVEIGKGGRITRQCLRGISTSGYTSSPRPQQSTRPPKRKAGTSDPRAEASL